MEAHVEKENISGNKLLKKGTNSKVRVEWRKGTYLMKIFNWIPNPHGDQPIEGPQYPIQYFFR